MEQTTRVKNNATSNAENNQSHLETTPSSKILFILKNHTVVQQNLIDTILSRCNCSIEYLACMLRLDAKKLSAVWQGTNKLTAKKAHDLVSLFYILCR